MWYTYNKIKENVPNFAIKLWLIFVPPKNIHKGNQSIKNNNVMLNLIVIIYSKKNSWYINTAKLLNTVEISSIKQYYIGYFMSKNVKFISACEEEMDNKTTLQNNHL